MSESGLPANVSSNEGLGVGAKARWYCVSRDGQAMLCLNEHNAQAMAAQNDTDYPNQAPYKAVALGDVAAERERWASPVRTLLAAHDASLDRIGTLMRAHNLQTLTLPIEAADELAAMQALRDVLTPNV